MNTSINTFNFNSNNDASVSVRVVDNDGSPWFVAKDVCGVLELEARDSVRYLDDDEKSYVLRRHLGLPPGKDMTIINESGLYSLILRSRKPEAKAFKKWVTSEVLPTIRKTGGYLGATPEMSNEEILAKAYQISQATIAELSKKNHVLARKQHVLENARDRLQKATDNMRPKAEKWEKYLSSGGHMNFTGLAKSMGMSARKLCDALRQKGLLMDGRRQTSAGNIEYNRQHNLPYQQYITKGFFEVKPYQAPHGAHTGMRTFVTPVGFEAIHKMYNRGRLPI